MLLWKCGVTLVENAPVTLTVLKAGNVDASELARYAASLGEESIAWGFDSGVTLLAR